MADASPHCWREWQMTGRGNSSTFVWQAAKTATGSHSSQYEENRPFLLDCLTTPQNYTLEERTESMTASHSGLAPDVTLTSSPSLLISTVTPKSILFIAAGSNTKSICKIDCTWYLYNSWLIWDHVNWLCTASSSLSKGEIPGQSHRTFSLYLEVFKTPPPITNTMILYLFLKSITSVYTKILTVT